MTTQTAPVVHFHQSDGRFCGTTQQLRRWTTNPNDVTCAECKEKDRFVLSPSGRALLEELGYPVEPARFRVRVNLNDDGFLVAARALPTGGFEAVLGFGKSALRFGSNDEAIAAVARCVNIDAATIEPLPKLRPWEQQVSMPKHDSRQDDELPY